MSEAKGHQSSHPIAKNLICLLRTKLSFHLKEGPDYRPFLIGNEINRYSIDWSGTYLKYGKHLAAPRDPKIFEGKRLLIRGIPAKVPYSLIATFTNDNYIREESIENIYALKASPCFLLGVINSKLETFWAVNKYDMLQRKTYPQLRLYRIRDLPIPNTTKEQQDEVKELVKKMLQLTSEGNPDKEKTDALNEKVMDLYGLTESDKTFVYEFLADEQEEEQAQVK